MTTEQHRLGIDIGGTFTDLSLWHAGEGRLITLKVPTVRARPADGVIAGLERLRTEHGITPASIGSFVHGTTIALNTLIERDGARLGLLVTSGFRDLLVIQRLRMPTPYNWRTGRPAPLLPRRNVYEVAGRLGPEGEEEAPLDAAAVDAAADAAVAAGLDGLVVCFLHAYRSPVHEQLARARIEARAPGLLVCCSHEIWPRIREYERALISVINAYVAPKVDRYLQDLETRLAGLGMPGQPMITQSSGGVISARSARRVPVETLLSGPAAGVTGAMRVAAAAGVRDFITLDIGGTSADVAFIQDGVARISQSEHVADFPLLMPVVGVSSVGAGGGSVVAVDAAGVMRVGPRSVGADPGPACYGRGGTVPAVTDAFLVGGYLNPDSFAGGHLALSVPAARAALAPLAERLGRDEAGTVDAILQVAASSIYAELSNLAARQGVALGDYAIMPFGGAGPLLAATVAEELGIRRIVVPATPGTLCSLGALLSDVSKPFIRSIMLPLSDAAPVLRAGLAALEAEADRWLASEAPALDSRRIEVAADMRYIGQSYEVDVALEPDWLRRGALDAIAAAFHHRHRALFAHADEAAPVELVDIRLTCIGTMPKPPIHAQVNSIGDAQPGTPYGTRGVAIAGRFRPVALYRRADLPAGARLTGPAIVEQADTTVYLPPGWQAAAHPSGALLMERMPA